MWAYDLGCRPGQQNHPKSFVAAPLETFRAAYASIPAEHRHAYEVVDSACVLYFDLESTGEHRRSGDEMARRVAAVGREVLTEAAASHGLSVRVECVAVDSAHPSKFSRHLLLIAIAASDQLVLLPGPRNAGALAARVAERVGEAARVIDRAVYAKGRCLRLVGSSKLTGAYTAPLLFNAQLSSISEEAAGLALAAPASEGQLILPSQARMPPPSAALVAAPAAPSTASQAAQRSAARAAGRLSL